MKEAAVKDENLFTILLSSRQTEKSTLLEMHRQYVFRVKNDATKLQIKKAVETLFNVAVESVRICNVKAKARQFGRIPGQRKGWKKAYVMLKEGDLLKFTGA